MAFPTSPTDGQRHSTGGYNYEYDATLNAWVLDARTNWSGALTDSVGHKAYDTKALTDAAAKSSGELIFDLSTDKDNRVVPRLVDGGGVDRPFAIPRRVKDVATLLAFSSDELDYTGFDPAIAGQVIKTEVESVSYAFADAAAIDHHLTTAGGVKLYVLPNDNGLYQDAAFGATTDNIDSVVAIQQCFDVAAAAGIPAEITGTRRTSRSMVITHLHSGLTIEFNNHEIKILDGIDFPAVAPEIASMFVFDVPAGQTLRDFRANKPNLNGNRANLGASGNNIFSSGIWTNTDSLGDYENVVVDRAVIRDTNNIGILESVGGVSFLNPFASGNRWHGMATADKSGSEYSNDRFAHFVSPITVDNDQNGFDFSRGRAVVDGTLISRRNNSGGGKTSVNCRMVKIQHAIFEDNMGFGFRSTGAMPDLEFSADRIEVRRTTNDGTASFPGQGFNMASGKRIEIGTLISEDNDNYLSTNAAYDVSLVLEDVQVDSLRVGNSDGSGVYVASDSYNIGRLEVEGSNHFGALLSGGGTVNSFVMKNNNKAGGTGTNAPPLRFTSSGVHSVNSGLFIDDQGAATQTEHIYALGGANVHINNVSFNLTPVIRTASPGTKVTFGKNNTGISTYTDGSYSGNGGSTVVQLPTGLNAFSNAKYRGFHVATSQDASATHIRTGINQANLTLTYDATLPSGTGNITLDYHAELWLEV